MSKKSAKKASRPRGRPFKYTVAQAQKLVDSYFKECDEEQSHYTITGLALALDTSRKSLCEWERDDHHLSNTIKRAKTRIEAQVEKMLFSGGAAAGPIFWLKNFGWTDKQEHQVNPGAGLEALIAGTMPKEDSS